MDQVRTWDGISGLLHFKNSGGAFPQTLLVTHVSGARFACLPTHKFLDTAMLFSLKLVEYVFFFRSCWSHEVFSNCNPGLIAPPTDLKVTKVESRMAMVQWTNPGADPAMKSATSSQLRYSNQEGTWDVNTKWLTTSHTLTGLTPYTNYTVKVLLVDSAGRGLWSAELEFTTDSEGQSANL